MSGKHERSDLESSRRTVGQAWGRIHPERWRAVCDLDGAGSILDVGCSSGSYVKRLRAEGRKAWGTDILIDDGWTDPTYFQSDASALPLQTNSVDHVIAFEVLEHLPRPLDYLSEFRRVARSKIVLSVPNCEVPELLRRSGVTFHHWVDPTHVNFFTRETLSKTLVEAGLSVDSITLINPIRPELLLLLSWRLSGRVAELLARGLERLPWRRALPMTILATASADRG